MATKNFTNPRARFFDKNGEPLEGRVWFYEAGTNYTTLKDVYTTRAGDVPADNPQNLDIEGFVESQTGIHLGEGLYDILVQERTGLTTYADYWNYPDVDGAPGSADSNILTTQFVETIADLKALGAGTFQLVFVSGYYEGGDGGARWMKWNSTSGVNDNGGTIIIPGGDPAFGRWEWLPQVSEKVTPQLFGAFPSDGSLVVASQFSSMINWCDSSAYKEIEIDLAGDYWVNSTTTFVNDLSVTIYPGVVFRNAAGFSTMIFNCQSVNIKGLTNLVNPTPLGPSMGLEIDCKEPSDVRPEWWNADDTAATDSAFLFGSLTNNLGTQHRIVLEGNYALLSSSVDFSPYSVLFKPDTTVSMGGADWILGDVEVQSTSPVIVGDDWDLVKFIELFASTKWIQITDGNPNYEVLPALNNFITNNTNNGTTDFEFEVAEGLYNLSFGVNSSDRGNDYHLRFNWSFEKGSLFTTASLIEFGYVSAGNYPVFSPLVSADYKMSFINDVKLPWFGAVSGNTSETANQNAIRSAYSQVALSNDSSNFRYVQRVSLDLCGGTFKTTPILSSLGIVTPKKVPVIDGVIWGDAAVTGPLLSFPHGIVGKNLVLESRAAGMTLIESERGQIGFTNCDLKSKADVVDSTSTSRLAINNCEFEITSADLTTYDFIKHNGQNSSVKNNEFIRTKASGTAVCAIRLDATLSDVSNNHLESCSIYTTGSGSIKDNYLNKGSIEILNTGSTVVTGNKIVTDDNFDSRIHFTAATPRNTVGLVCKYNEFSDGVSDPSTRTPYIAVGKTNTNSGQDWCDVSENYGNLSYLYMGTTHINVALDKLSRTDNVV